MSTRQKLIALCDLDGTLIDSDAALANAFVVLGVERSDITFGHVLADECDRLGLSVSDYLDAYDASHARPFDGVEQLVAGFNRWAICSNKHPQSGNAELSRLGWNPELALFADAFDGPKQLQPVLDALAVTAEQVVFLGDTAHDRRCAAEAGVRFALAGWNPRAVAEAGDLVMTHPHEFLELLGV